MTTPINSLRMILILSAIDVLLCSFTAAITLLLIGAGADAANNRGAEMNSGEGAPGAIVIATYGRDAARFSPVSSAGVRSVPAEGWQDADSVAWMLDVPPTDRAPFMLKRDAGAGSIAVTINLSGAGEPRNYLVTCLGNGAAKLMIGKDSVRSTEAQCSIELQP